MIICLERLYNTNGTMVLNSLPLAVIIMSKSIDKMRCNPYIFQKGGSHAFLSFTVKKAQNELYKTVVARKINLKCSTVLKRRTNHILKHLSF